MDWHAFGVSLGTAAALGGLAGIGMDIRIVLKWASQSDQSFWQVFQPQVAIKNVVVAVCTPSLAVFTAYLAKAGLGL